MEEKLGVSHRLTLNNRDRGNLTGILDVISFNESQIVLDTDMGLLTIRGKTSMSAGFHWKRAKSTSRGGRTASPTLQTKASGRPVSRSFPACSSRRGWPIERIHTGRGRSGCTELPSRAFFDALLRRAASFPVFPVSRQSFDGTRGFFILAVFRNHDVFPAVS